MAFINMCFHTQSDLDKYCHYQKLCDNDCECFDNNDDASNDEYIDEHDMDCVYYEKELETRYNRTRLGVIVLCAAINHGYDDSLLNSSLVVDAVKYNNIDLSKLLHL